MLPDNCQVPALGGRVIVPEFAARMVKQGLLNQFDPASSMFRKVGVLSGYEETGALPA